MIRVSQGLDALTSPEQHDALHRLLTKSFGAGAAEQVLGSMADMRQYFFFRDGLPVAVLSTRPKGVIHCARTPRANVIYNAATTPRHRRKGYMRQLLKRVVADHRQQGCRCLNLEVLQDNHKAARLYASLGFQIVDAQNDIALMRLRI